MKKLYLVMPMIVVGVMGVSYLLHTPDAEAQSGSRRSPTKPFEAKFWDYLQSARYTNWAPGPGQNGDFYEGSSPHGAFLKMYLNRTAAADPKGLSHGSVVIKENYGEDKKTLMAVTIMYRSKGYNAEAGDWYWVKYMPDGTVAKSPPDKSSMRLAGKVKGCIMCHSGADGDDFAFIND